MLNANSPRLQWSTSNFALVLAAAVSLALATHAEEPFAAKAGAALVKVQSQTQSKGAPEDWTHHRLVFSNPGTEQEAIRGGRYAQWLKIVNDPRYAMSQLKRSGSVAVSSGSAPSSLIAAPDTFGLERTPDTRFERKKFDAGADLKKDWNESVSTSTAPSPRAYPAKWSFDTTTASCANDFVIYPTGAQGSPTQASLVAYYNLYDTTCNVGPVPSVDFAFDTEGTVALSPVFSLGGNQIAFVQATSLGTAELVVLNYPITPPYGGTIGSPIVPNPAGSASDYFTGTGCASPCQYHMIFSGSPGDTWSNPYYDYGSDTIYVGDSLGLLHKFTPVFNGPPAEVTTGNWPVQMNNGSADTNQLASPVYDPVSGNVFVGSTSTGCCFSGGGYFYSVNGSTGTIHGFTSNPLDASWGIRDAPLLDETAGELYVFAGVEFNVGETGVFQLATSFTSGTGNEVFGASNFGSGANEFQFAGTFDNTYYTSGSPTTPTGNIYFCNASTPNSILTQVPIHANVMQSPVLGPTLGAGYCSGVSEFYNSANSEDLIFLSVYDGSATGCTNSASDGCVMSFNVTSPSSFSNTITPLGALNVSAPGTAAAVTGGFIVDNGASGTGESQIYFLTQNPSGTSPCTGVCAIQASQIAP
jgi:hypothetical protein